MMDYTEVEWLKPKIDWTAQDKYNYYDLNRVENNTLKVYLLMKYVLGSPDIESVVLDRDYSTIEFADSLNRLERNIQTLSNQLKLDGIKPSKTNWQVGDPFDYNDANRLETNLAILYPVLLNNLDTLRYCGTFNCGEEAV